MRSVGIVGISSALSMFVACGDSEQSSFGSERAFIDELTKILCNDDFAECCVAVGHTYEDELCRSYVATYDDAPARGTRWDPDAARDCIEAAKTARMTCDGAPDGTEACWRIYRPTLGEGDTCEYDEECVYTERLPLRCVQSTDRNFCSTAGFVTFEHGQVGDACSQTCSPPSIEECARQPRPEILHVACRISEGVYCDTSTGTCQPLPGDGEPCQTYCQEGSRCVGGICELEVPLGSPCDVQTFCTGSCLDGLCAPRAEYFHRVCRLF